MDYYIYYRRFFLSFSIFSVYCRWNGVVTWILAVGLCGDLLQRELDLGCPQEGIGPQFRV